MTRHTSKGKVVSQKAFAPNLRHVTAHLAVSKFVNAFLCMLEDHNDVTSVYVFWLFFLCLGSSCDLLDVCTYPDTDGYTECVMDSRPVVIVLSDCMIQGLRLTGEGYLVGVRTSGGFQEIIEVAVQRTTLTCEEGLEQFPVAEVYLAGTKYTRKPTITTTTATEVRNYFCLNVV